jgi:hypothetical protein
VVVVAWVAVAWVAAWVVVAWAVAWVAVAWAAECSRKLASCRRLE